MASEIANAKDGLGTLIGNISSVRQVFDYAPDGVQEFPAMVVQYHYQLCEDPDRAEPLIWKGAPMTVPADPAC